MSQIYDPKFWKPFIDRIDHVNWGRPVYFDGEMRGFFSAQIYRHQRSTSFSFELDGVFDIVIEYARVEEGPIQGGIVWEWYKPPILSLHEGSTIEDVEAGLMVILLQES